MPAAIRNLNETAMKPITNTYLAFDPGHKLGAAAWVHETSAPDLMLVEGHPYYGKFESTDIQTATMDEIRNNFPTIASFTRHFGANLQGVAIEKIPFLDSPGCAKLFMNYGQIVEAATDFEVFMDRKCVVSLTPQQWKRTYSLSKPGMTYDEHKKAATGCRRKLFPQETPIRACCDDAVLILQAALPKLRAAVPMP